MSLELLKERKIRPVSEIGKRRVLTGRFKKVSRSSGILL